MRRVRRGENLCRTLEDKTNSKECRKEDKKERVTEELKKGKREMKGGGMGG